MADIKDAASHFVPAELVEMEELVKINEEMKKLETRKKVLSDKIKDNMIRVHVDKIAVAGSVLSISESQRRTVIKSTKDEFVANLVGSGLGHLVTHSIEPNIDDIMQDVDAGTIAKDFVDKYVKVTPVVTLRCT